MSVKSIALAATLLVTSVGVNAALITNLSNLDINGTNYDVTFHTGAGDSFNALWDADDDGVFGGGASVFAAAPTFWGDSASAEAAGAAIMLALGSADWTNATGGDGFIVPYYTFTGTGITDQLDSMKAWYETEEIDLVTDSLFPAVMGDRFNFEAIPYTSFSVSAVPVPAAVWLFGSGLLGLIGVARRKVRV